VLIDEKGLAADHSAAASAGKGPATGRKEGPMTPAPAAARAPSAAEPSDQSLLAAAAARELRAFEVLYKRYYPRLSRFVLNITRRPQLVEEVINDTMVVVWNKAGGYAGRSRVSTWIFSIAYRRALKALRRWDVPVSDTQSDTRPSLDAGPEQQVGDGQVREVLLRAISELSEAHRAVVDLAYFHEFGYREIAEIVRCPVDTVKTRMFHARRHLRTKLAGQLADWL
jgi:RNA polymerase sigma-70 factor (ECF subfamily)